MPSRRRTCIRRAASAISSSSRSSPPPASSELPILGICRGIQLINVAMGGTLFQDLPSERPGRGRSQPDRPSAPRGRTRCGSTPGSRAAAALGTAPLAVNSFHHQAIRDLANGTGGDGVERGRTDRGGGDGAGHAVAAGGAVAPGGDVRRGRCAGARALSCVGGGGEPPGARRSRRSVRAEIPKNSIRRLRGREQQPVAHPVERAANRGKALGGGAEQRVETVFGRPAHDRTPCRSRGGPARRNR